MGSKHLTINSNSGVSSSNLIRDLPGLGPVWLDPRAIANVLSLSSVCKLFRFTQDSYKYDGFHLHRPDGDTLEFHESKKGLYYYDATPKGYNINNKSTVTNYSLVTTGCSAEPTTLHPAIASEDC
jgi:hypothetical protein